MWIKMHTCAAKYFPFSEICVCLFKGGKAQIIGPEEEDEEYDGYAFNEVT